MIADINITEKSFGPKTLMTGVKFSIDDAEKVGVIGRNGIGKSTLFGILAGTDKDYSGEVIYKRGTTVVATAQEHHRLGDTTVLQYVLAGLPEYPRLSHVIETYPSTMGDDMRKIEEYTAALQRFDDKGFYQIEERIERELDHFQLPGVAHRSFDSLSGGQKRLVEVIKIMHSDAHLALIDEPTNHMDYVAKAQFIDWVKQAPEAMLIITHDRDVLQQVDRIVELKDGGSVSYKGNYDAYLKQNAVSTGSAMTEFELTERRIENLKAKVVQFRRLKERARDPDTIKQFKRRENEAAKELAQLQEIKKPTFWIDKDSAESLDYKAATRYSKFKAKNIRMNMKNDESRSKHVLVSAKNLSLGYGDAPLFEGVNIDLREGEAVELRGRNGAGKTTLIKALLAPYATLLSLSPQMRSAQTASVLLRSGGKPESSEKEIASGSDSADAHTGFTASDLRSEANDGSGKARIALFSGELKLDSHARVGVYEQEVSPRYFGLTLHDAIERMYLDKDLSIGETKIRQLMADYLFVDSDAMVPIEKLSGGQKARFQVISMLAHDPQLLILDEPTNHLDLPSIEELETALDKFTGAVLYVSHDNYFRDAMGGEVVQIGS